MFIKGRGLADKVERRLRTDIELFSYGGLAVLDTIEAIGYNTLVQRPTIHGLAKLRLLGRALFK